MLRLSLGLERGLNWITSFSGWISGIAMVLMILLIFSNMFARYALGTGAMWLQELEWYLLSLSVMTGISYAMRYDEHVRVDIFSHNFSRIGKLWLDLLTMVLVALPVSALMIFYGWDYMMVSYTRSEGSPNPGGMPWLFLPKMMILVGFVLIIAEALRQALRAARKLVFHYRRPSRNNKENARHAA
ncbi:TRAP transporter small permease subunit [Thioalkalivibrio sulfidiphilus]|uniref:TRAP transporter small permease subunit n=1 Tax=Thioalkalivibrio sulfidiphilus TaxID=1033854 RepID=UPI0003670AAB|nr:TRAP transporter small permease subunit [Thioalkalivibrio sulfidiphilus]